MTCWAVIPVKAAKDSKSRLAGVLGDDRRQALVDAMLGHVVRAARQASSVAQVCMVGPLRHGLPEDVLLLDDPGRGLNPAVQAALEQVATLGPNRVIMIAADLPTVSPLDIDLLAAAPVDTIAIAPDRHGTGTNALSLPLPAASGFRFAYGQGSFARHCDEAERCGFKIETVLSRGLEKDIDEPADLPDAGDMLHDS